MFKLIILAIFRPIVDRCMLCVKYTATEASRSTLKVHFKYNFCILLSFFCMNTILKLRNTNHLNYQFEMATSV